MKAHNKARNNKRLIVPVLLLSLLVLPFTIKSGKQSLAVTSATEVAQLDAGYGAFDEGGTVKESHYVTIGWKGSASFYCVYQVMADKNEIRLSGGITPFVDEATAPTATPAATGASVTPVPAIGGLNTFKVTINKLEAATSYTFKIYESDQAGNKKDEKETGVIVENVRTTPGKLPKPTLIGIYKNLNDSDFSFRTDNYSDGYQVRAENYKGKKLYAANVSGDAVSSAAVHFSMKPCHPGKIVYVKVRGYVTIPGVGKRYGAWSDTVEYGYAKKLKLSGKKDTIKISGLKVEGAAKKEIYVSLKKNKGYKLAKKIGANKTSCNITKYGDKYIQSKKKYYVRVYYYYKVGKEMKKSPVYDQDFVFVKPAISYIRVE